MYNFLNSVVESRGQRLQWLGFSDCKGTERKSSAFVSIQPVYKCCRWLHHWNESLGNILASGRTGAEERQRLLPPPLLTRVFLPLFLLKTCSLWQQHTLESWSLKLKDSTGHSKIDPYLPLCPIRKSLSAKYLLLKIRPLYTVVKKHCIRSQNPRY